MLPCDEKKRLLHREFVEGAHGTVGETYDHMRLRVIYTISREEIEQQARYGKILAAEGRDEEVYGANAPGEECDEECDGTTMEDEEVHSLITAIDSGALSNEQVMALQQTVQRKGRCFNCGRPGHIAKNCRVARRRPGQYGKGGGKRGGGGGGGK